MTAASRLACSMTSEEISAREFGNNRSSRGMRAESTRTSQEGSMINDRIIVGPSRLASLACATPGLNNRTERSSNDKVVSFERKVASAPPSLNRMLNSRCMCSTKARSIKLTVARPNRPWTIQIGALCSISPPNH